ncbi:GTP 3',8-cyclase MoaA [Pacificimonas sp. WHA3]|uniref:GTP 3',8-cyclase n=1 Tax=Pacificimonas pallii TaxID=2827236 RepID=A0ABS6SET7_9SPHN|nr:GTP 3',8-cyclase MoaA [Pacificimonas pallii]MBV7256914.1 GTP 3',8-cyclase MoaA [Pacificimonas pallii]
MSSQNAPLVDKFGRHVTYLRISVTDRCDFRCTYCMAEDMTFLPRTEILSLEEIDRIASAFVRRGVRKLRLTGGEPLVRRGIVTLVERLSRHLDSGDLDELTLTSNGNQLTKHAAALANAGVKRINISLDTLDPELFRKLTRWGDLSRVMAGIDAATAVGMHVKLNAVALRGQNEDELETMMTWAHGRGHDMTFIETMPMGDTGEDRADHYLPLSIVRSRIAARYTLTPLAITTGGPARYFQVEETGRRLGFITPLTHNFCESCNRVRLTATGQLFMCLGQEDRSDLKAIIRATPDDTDLDAALDEAMTRKPKGHDFLIARGAHSISTPRHMSVTGG